MMKYLCWLPLLVLVISCKGKKKTTLQDDEAVTVTEFIEFFPQIPLPIRIADTTLLKRSTDSLQIGYKILTQFIPDSVLHKEFGKGVTPRFFPLGRAREEDNETYLFIKATTGTQRVAYVACFSKENTFLQMMPLVKTGFDQNVPAWGALDKKYQLTTYRTIRRDNGSSTYKRNVYFYNNAANEFTLILTEPNEDIIENVINPLDTLAATHKYSGDYIKDKKNIISLRDGKRPQEPQFFIHFEKGDCRGELKGTLRFVSNTVAVYQQGGNPCVIEFNFGKDKVTIKETGGCGSFRDIKCFFEGSFPKKKATKPAAKSKK